MKDFTAHKFYSYPGSNYYLNHKALVFNLYLDPNGHNVHYYEPEIWKYFPQLEQKRPERVVELFAEVLLQILKMDMDLFINHYEISRDQDDHVIAIQFLDERIAEDAVDLTCDWFVAMSEDRNFGFEERFQQLQIDFDRTLYGGPTIYSLIEAGLKRNIPVFYLPDENQFQWGMGKKQKRGRSTIFHTDGIKDTEFTQYKDAVKHFLSTCGFPTPTGHTVFSWEEALESVEELQYPVVMKPVAGHKGQGVTTNIQSEEDLQTAYQSILEFPEYSKDNYPKDGIIVERYITGNDHRLLAVGGKFVAALERVAAYIDGNGRDTIAYLIKEENRKEIRKNDARSPLAAIEIDEDLENFLRLQNLSLDSVPEDGQRIYLRRVANISAGGVSVNVTNKIHPRNIKLVEDIAKYFHLHVMGIDVLAEDISKAWDESSFGIIEINAGPGVYMHLAPAIGNPIDIPGTIMDSFFPEPLYSRIPIIAGNCLSLTFCQQLYQRLEQLKPHLEYGSITEEGIYVNGEYFFKNKKYYENVNVLLRNPRLEFAVFNHIKDDLFDDGTVYNGADVVILEDPHYVEKILERDILPDGYLVTINQDEITIFQGDDTISYSKILQQDSKEQLLLSMLGPLLPDLMKKYG